MGPEVDGGSVGDEAAVVEEGVGDGVEAARLAMTVVDAFCHAGTNANGLDAGEQQLETVDKGLRRERREEQLVGGFFVESESGQAAIEAVLQVLLDQILAVPNSKGLGESGKDAVQVDEAKGVVVAEIPVERQGSSDGRLHCLRGRRKRAVRLAEETVELELVELLGQEVGGWRSGRDICEGRGQHSPEK